MTKYHIVGQIKQSVVVILAKNIILPGLVFFSCTQLFGLSPHWTFIAVLMAAQPTGINAYIFAERYNTAQALASTTVLLSTTFSLLTIPALLYLYETVSFTINPNLFEPVRRGPFDDRKTATNHLQNNPDI